MSQQLISRSPDLKRLRDDGYGIEIRSGHLLLNGVPYLNERKEVRLGILVSVLDLTQGPSGEVTARPSTHVAYFIGDHPCDREGTKLHRIQHGGRKQLTPALAADHSFSSKPPNGYADYYDKMTTYVRIIAGPAQAIDPDATAKTFPVVTATEEESVFQYMDTASSRAGIAAATSKLEIDRVAIVGLGGTGAYVLDFVAKTPPREIHLFDGDKYAQHNAFRSPGAASSEDLAGAPKKVDYFARMYSRIRRRIIPHDTFITASNVAALQGMSFVFLCIDNGGDKRPIVAFLEAQGTPFIDVGMGVEMDDNQSLGGILRVTTSTPRQRAHVHDKARIAFSENRGDDEYNRNAQIADLNALNAALAVIKCKKLYGFYRDLRDEHFTAYTIDGNSLINEDEP